AKSVRCRTSKDHITFGVVAAISQKRWNRQFSTAHRPPNGAGKAIRAAECQGQTQKRKSRFLRCVHKGPLQTTSISPIAASLPLPRHGVFREIKVPSEKSASGMCSTIQTVAASYER